MSYDVVSGISVGAVNAGAFALFPKGQEKEAADFVVEKWTNLESGNLWKYWGLNIFHGIFSEQGLVDNSPLLEFIKSILGNKTFQRKLITGAVDLHHGGFVQLDSDEMADNEEAALSLLASASLPGLFPPTHLRNYTLIDGGSVWNLNIIGAIQKCRDLGFGDPNIVLDVVILIPDQIEVLSSGNLKAW